MPNNELAKRIKTAVILLVPIVGLLIAGGSVPAARLALLGIGFVAMGFASFEFATVCCAEHSGLHKSLYFMSCLLTPLILLIFGLFLYAEECAAAPFYMVTAVFTGVFFSFLFFVLGMFVFGRDAAVTARQLAQDLPVGIFLIGLCGSCLISLPLTSTGVGALSWLVLVVMANDIGAYFTGKQFGGPKLAPYLSPKKTISGSVGGLLAGLLLGCLVVVLLPGDLGILRVLLLALIVGLAGQGGDLLKSYVKRLHDVKDMGAILPGHGGVLDRLDGMLAAAPIVFLLVVYSSF